MNVGAFTSVCEEDRDWIPQYLGEVFRLDIPFAVHFDRCSSATKTLLMSHPHCVGFTANDNPDREFEEWDKQGVLNILKDKGFHWGLAWDIDETWENDAATKIRELTRTTEADYVDCRWANLWDDKDHVRVDNWFKTGHRVKLYRLSLPWRFDHKITNGAKADGAKEAKSDLTCIHWGMMTHDMRVFHKARWDRIYTKAVGNNPYGFWKGALEYDQFPPVVVPYDHGTFDPWK